MRRRLDLVLVVAVALAANAVYLVASNGDYFFPDSFTYLGPAHHLLHGYGFVTEPGTAETLRTPVYPLFLAPFLLMTESALPVVVLQHLMNALLAAALYLLMMRRLGSRFAALAAALLFALDTPSIHMANKVLTETPFTLLLFAIFVLALELRRLPLVGLLCGVLVLLRPVAIAYFGALVLYLVLRRVPWRQVTVFAIVAASLPLAWGLRNQAETGVFTVASIGGTNLLFYRAAGALAIDEEPDDFKATLARVQKELLAEADAVMRKEEEEPNPRALDHAVQAKYFTRVALEVLAANKLALAQLTVRGLLINLFDSDWEAIMMVSPLDSTLVRVTLDAAEAALVLLALAGLWSLRRRDPALALLIALTAAYFLLISAGGESEYRFRVPVVPLLAIAAGMGLEGMRRGARGFWA
jgi:hypothetical protein